MKWMGYTVKAAVLGVLAGLVALQTSHLREKWQLEEQVDRLSQEKADLASFAERLQASRRVAQVDVVKQYPGPADSTVTVLLWQEIAEDGTLGRPLALEVQGEQIYFEGYVLKFDQSLLHAGAVENHKGASLVLFRRIFGNAQTPDSAREFDRLMGPPGLEGEGPGGDERELWTRFWDLTRNPGLAKESRVRVAQCEAPSVRMRTGEVWQLNLDAAGGLNLKKVADRRAAETSAVVP